MTMRIVSPDEGLEPPSYGPGRKSRYDFSDMKVGEVRAVPKNHGPSARISAYFQLFKKHGYPAKGRVQGWVKGDEYFIKRAI